MVGGTRRRLIVAGLALVALARARAGAAASPAAPAAFSAERPGATLPAGWREQTLRGVAPNRFSLVADAGVTVLRIEVDGSASSVVHPLDPGQRRLRWRWLAEGFPAAGRSGARATDDFAARVYVLFDYPMSRVPFVERWLIRAARLLYGDAVPAAALCYVWEPGGDPTRWTESAYTSRVRVRVLRTDVQTGVWREEARDLAADFAEAFGAEHGPGFAPVRAVALAADGDQTAARFAARFGDVAVG